MGPTHKNQNGPGSPKKGGGGGRLKSPHRWDDFNFVPVTVKLIDSMLRT